jgi:peptide/nickel transport system substrate-binding protein
MRPSATRAIAAIAVSIAIAVFSAAPVEAKVFRWAFQGDVLSLDPQDRRDTFSRDFVGNIMEPLVKFNERLEIEPALAERWEILDPTLWRFHLRKGVKFSNGNVFNADDVVFTFKRGAAPVSPFRGILRAVKEVRKVDDHTVDFVLNTPYPILDRDLSNMHIYDQEWVEANNASAPVELVQGKAKPSYLATHILGTGPFALKSYEPDAKIVLEANPLWWGKPKHNLTEVVFTPIKSGATRIAALLSGQVDMIFPVPPQDVARIEHTSGFKILQGPELRTVFIGMDQGRDELLESSVKGKNPFKDIRVRRAISMAIDVEAIRQKVMGGQSTPNGSMIAPSINGFDPAIGKSVAYDPVAAKKLMSEAGYDSGFEVTFDCSEDRAVNEAQICTAIAAMLQRIGMTARLNVQARSKHFDKILGVRSTFYMMSWAGLPTVDALGTLSTVIHTRLESYGTWNLGGYSNPKLDELVHRVEVEIDGAKRNTEIREALKMHKDDVGHIPIHTQHSAWAVRDGISLRHTADDFVRLETVVVEK